jgi:predicted DNA repair protein MutK
LGATSASVRAPAAAAAALLLWVYGAVGYAWTEPGNRCSVQYWEDWWQATLCLPLFFVTVQAPLWLTRTLIGLRIELAHESRRSAEPGDVTIRHLMLVTAVVAASLALTRMASPGDSSAVVGIVVGSLVTGAVSLITTLPAAVLMLSTRRLRNGLLGAVLHTAAILAIVKVGFLVAEIADGNRGRMRPPLWFLAGVAVLVIHFSVCLAGVLICVRGMGYRLQRARRSGQRTEEAVRRSSSE